jgi:biotin operon repressor
MGDIVRDLRVGDWAWFSKAVLERKLGWKANLAYMGLVSFASSKDQTCFPSKGTLAELLGVSKTTIYEGLQALKEAGLIDVTERKNGDTTLSNEYTLLPIPHAQYEPPVRNTNGDVVRNTNPPMRNTNDNKIQEQDLTGNKIGVGGESNQIQETIQEPDSVDTRILCEELGVFRIKEQEEINRMYRAFCRSQQLTPIAGREHLKRRWGDYQAAMPKLEWAFASAYSFLMSGIWNMPELWQKKKSAKADPMSKMKFTNA